jgi:hypothetical protein
LGSFALHEQSCTDSALEQGPLEGGSGRRSLAPVPMEISMDERIETLFCELSDMNVETSKVASETWRLLTGSKAN